MNLLVIGVIFALAAGLLTLGFVPVSYAHNPSGIAPPGECKPFTAGTEFVHTMDASKFPIPAIPESILPGDNVIAIANFNNPLNPQFQTEDFNQVRFLWFDGTGTLQQETVVPVDTSIQTIAQDIFLNVFGPNTTWTVVACYENNDRTVEAETIDIDVDTFFVAPESPIGVIALGGSTLGTLGAYVGISRFRARL